MMLIIVMVSLVAHRHKSRANVHSSEFKCGMPYLNMRGVEFNILIQMWQISAMNKYKHSNTGGRPVNSTGQLVHIGEHNGTFTHSMEQLG